MTVADEPLSLNFLSLLLGTSTAEEFREEYADDLYSANVFGLVGNTDETYSSEKGAKKTLRKKNARWKAAGETWKPYGYGFCVASAYLPQLDCFASLQCRNTDFAWLLAATLATLLDGVDYWLSDGGPCCNGRLAHKEGYLLCYLRQLVRTDEHVTAPRKVGELEELSGYLEMMCVEAAADRAAVLR